jgi:hypothetical protein
MEKDGELVEVIAHDPSGRIKKYLKTPVSRNDVVALRAQARLHAEEAECAAAIKEANALIEKARDPQPTLRQLQEKAHRPSALPPPVAHDVPAATPSPNLGAAAPAPQQPGPSPAVDRRSHRERSTELRDLERLAADLQKEVAKNVAWRKQHEAQRKETRKILDALTVTIASRDGKSIGRMVMAKTLALVPPDTPNTATVTIKGGDVQHWMQQAYDQLCEQDYYPDVRTAEYAKAFTEAFMLGVYEAKAQFETTPRQPTTETMN